MITSVVECLATMPKIASSKPKESFYLIFTSKCKSGTVVKSKKNRDKILLRLIGKNGSRLKIIGFEFLRR